jgi:hypothetical protein
MDRTALLLPGPVRLAVQVERPTSETIERLEYAST